jgi:hypothetical protein
MMMRNDPSVTDVTFHDTSHVAAFVASLQHNTTVTMLNLRGRGFWLLFCENTKMLLFAVGLGSKPLTGVLDLLMIAYIGSST